MRITGGTACGRKLQGPGSRYKTDIRPTSDRVREALGNILDKRFQSASVLDLFAGTGSFGIEALSRGADYVVFVDNSNEALTLIRNNLKKCFTQPSAHIVKADLNYNYKIIPLFQKLEATHCFDIIYLDPPYEKKIAGSIMEVLEKSDMIRSKSMVIIEERWKDTNAEVINGFKLVMKRKYGETGIRIYERI